MARLTGAGKVGIFVLASGVVLTSFWFLRKYIAPEGQKEGDVKGLMASGSSKDGSADTPNSATVAAAGPHKCIEIGVVTWGGYVGGQYWNGGFKDNPSSRYHADGICVNFTVLDDFDASRSAFRNGKMDLMWGTFDSFPTESGNYGGIVKMIFQSDWSQGGDAIVVTSKIKTTADLVGKKIAVAESTPSHTLLLWMLDSAGISPMDVTIVKQKDAGTAVDTFKSGNVDAAVVWSPGDDEAVTAVAGSKVLISTKQASHIIADGFFVKQETFDRRRDDLLKLVRGWLKGAAEINESSTAKSKAANILHEGCPAYQPEFCLKAINNVRLTTYGDNLQFFGLDPSYKGTTGKELYEKMTTVYGKLNLAQNPLPYDKVVDLDFIKDLKLDNDKAQAAAKKAVFTAPTVQVQQAAPVASKAVRVSFATNSTALDENAKGIIDMMFVEQAKAFPGQHFKIIGNTDNTGNAAINKRISQARAESVVSYLTTLGFDRNQFLPVGSGPDNPLCTEDTEPCRAKNRRTDFVLLDK